MYSHAMRAETDATGNVYVLSRMAVLSGTSLVGMDMQLTKYSPAGVRQWTRSFGASSATSDSMVITPAGKVVVSGRSSSVADQVQLAAFDAAGNQVWAKGIASGADLGLAVGPAGELYAVGAPASTQGMGFLVVKHDANFNELWRNTYAARGYAHRAAVDAAGNLVVSGVVDTNTGLLQVVMYDWMTLKLDPNGALLWSRLKGQNGANDVPYGLALGSDGSAYITGEAKASTTTATLGSGGTGTLKVAADGSQAWIDVTTSASRGLGVKLGSDGGVWVVGESPHTVFRYPQNGLPNQPPVAMASASPSAGVAPLSVAFSSAGSADPDGAIAWYTWDFGDGQSSTAANPSHSYAAGSYSARLTVTDTLGASSTSAPIAITANLAPSPAQPTALTLAKAVVTEGTNTTATVTVSSSAGVTVALSSSNSNVASVPSKVVIPAGSTSASFTVKASSVKRDTVVTLGASANGATATASLTVRNR